MSNSLANFRNAAAYFALRAEKARKPEYKQRFADAADFYDRLANITSTFPPGYKDPRPARAGRFLNRAEECRTMAECFKDEECRRQLLALAEDYERLAVGDVLTGN